MPNPYSGETFIGFFWQLAKRLFLFLTGNASGGLASDEIQMLALSGIAVSSSLVGTFLYFRKMTMVANAISHTILLGIAAAFLLTESYRVEAMFIASLIIGVGTAFLTEWLAKKTQVKEDASTALVFTTFLALGILLVSFYFPNAHIGAEIVMGSVDALHRNDLALVYFILCFNVLLCGICFKEYQIMTFDPNFSKVLGAAGGVLNYLLMAQVSATVVGAFRAIGVLMVLSFITGLPMAARLLSRDLSQMLKIGACLGCLVSVIGVAAARHLLTAHALSYSTGGIVVCTVGILYLSALMLNKFRKVV